MYLVYFDESGDTGVVNSPTAWFVLNAVLVHETAWLSTLDELVNLRRSLRDRYNILPEKEIKGMHFRKGQGAFAGLEISRRKRFQIYEEIMDFQAQLKIKTYSVAVNKASARRAGWESRLAAWKSALEHLDHYCATQNEYATLFPDEGHGYFVTQLVRSMRRYNAIVPPFGGSPVQVPVDRILEDPSDRKSEDSYFVQLADLNVYATHRHSAVDPRKRVPNGLWDRLGGPKADIRILGVNRSSGGPPGIVRYV